MFNVHKITVNLLPAVRDKASHKDHGEQSIGKSDGHCHAQNGVHLLHKNATFMSFQVVFVAWTVGVDVECVLDVPLELHGFV
ncbi:hypothetical protein TYRP_019992 [Tyrophagus putrescentiae]|nr:hypothetical protein TYRP_019992 [Tyrophagus putrescentiae]